MLVEGRTLRDFVHSGSGTGFRCRDQEWNSAAKLLKFGGFVGPMAGLRRSEEDGVTDIHKSSIGIPELFVYHIPSPNQPTLTFFYHIHKSSGIPMAKFRSSVSTEGRGQGFSVPVMQFRGSYDAAPEVRFGVLQFMTEIRPIRRG